MTTDGTGTEITECKGVSPTHCELALLFTGLTDGIEGRGFVESIVRRRRACLVATAAATAVGLLVLR